MEEQEIEKLYELLEKVIYSATKADAKKVLSQLELKRRYVGEIYGGNASYKLAEAMDSARSAAGRVSDKEHHKLRAEMHWSTFKSILARTDLNEN